MVGREIGREFIGELGRRLRPPDANSVTPAAAPDAVAIRLRLVIFTIGRSSSCRCSISVAVMLKP